MIYGSIECYITTIFILFMTLNQPTFQSSLGRVSNQKTFGISVAVVLQGRSHSLTLNHQRQSTEGKYDVLK